MGFEKFKFGFSEQFGFVEMGVVIFIVNDGVNFNCIVIIFKCFFSGVSIVSGVVKFGYFFVLIKLQLVSVVMEFVISFVIQ